MIATDLGDHPDTPDAVIFDTIPDFKISDHHQGSAGGSPYRFRISQILSTVVQLLPSETCALSHILTIAALLFLIAQNLTIEIWRMVMVSIVTGDRTGLARSAPWSSTEDRLEFGEEPRGRGDAVDNLETLDCQPERVPNIGEK